MAVFRNKTKDHKVAITTAALPDIVFILLFFFMVVTVFRKDSPILKTSVPGASQNQKIHDKSLVINLYVGFPKDKKLGTEPLVSGEDFLMRPDEIPQYIEAQRSLRPANEQGKLIVNLKVDQRVKMGIIQDVKQALRKVDARKINYETVSGEVL